jgi:FkbM family methyltransferase
MATGARRQMLRLARKLGAEPQLRALQRALVPEVARNSRDDAALKLVMAATLRPASNCIDIGANVGAILELMETYAPEGRHIAFEPLPDRARMLERRHPGIEVRELALSDRSGEASFARNPDDDARSGFRAQDGGAVEEIKVRTERLDDALPEGYVPALVKIDVEGAEQEVIRGGLETIARHKPVVAFEHGAAARLYGTSSSQIHELLCREAGLAIFDMDGNGPLSADAFTQLASAKRGRWNFFARPLGS